MHEMDISAVACEVRQFEGITDSQEVSTQSAGEPLTRSPDVPGESVCRLGRLVRGIKAIQGSDWLVEADTSIAPRPTARARSIEVLVRERHGDTSVARRLNADPAPGVILVQEHIPSGYPWYVQVRVLIVAS